MRQVILVTGASGNVGRLVLEELRALGVNEVRAFVRPAAADAGSLPAGIEATLGTFEEPATLSNSLVGVDAVFLVWPFMSTDGAREVLERIGAEDRRLVYVSSIGVGTHQHHVDPIFGMHAEMEALVQASGLSSTVLRVDTIASNTLGWADQIRATGVVRGPLSAPTAVIDPRDIAAVAARVLTGEPSCQGGILCLTGPEVISRPAQVQAIGNAIGRDLRFERVPVHQARAQMLAAGRPPALVDALLASAETRSESQTVTATVAEIAGRQASSFQEWANAFRESFL